MSYQVLARKWRPQVFEDVVGQEHITNVLMNALETGRIHHGYLFSGIRGIGKTTTARILAKALNCLHGPTAHPCNQCEFCQEITEGYSIDIEEIDGASNRGVDDVRILQENTGYAPSRSRYKVFIIDEVHMLTPEAFNALLKTLEEPPSNVVFILATTELWKIPMTILSRCQHFKFKNGTPDHLIALLRKIALHENITISERSLALLAKTASGSVRDAENLFDQVIGFCGNQVQDGDVRYVLGIPDRALLRTLLTSIFTHQSSQIFSLMEQIVGQGYNLRFVCMELMERLRNLAVLKVARQPEVYLSLFDSSREELEQYARQTSLSALQQLYWLIAQVERDIKFSPAPRFILEMGLVAMTKVVALEPMEDLYAQLRALEETLPQQGQQTAQPAEKVEPSAPVSVEEGQPASTPAPVQVSQNVLQRWEAVLNALKNKKCHSLAARLKNARPLRLTTEELLLGFHKDAAFSRGALDEKKNVEMLTEAVQEALGYTVRVSTTIDSAAVSPDSMQKNLEEGRSVPVPRPSSSTSARQAEPRAKSAPERRSRNTESRPRNTEQRSRNGNGNSYGDGKGKGSWQKRGASRKYKPPVQVSVQDVVTLFEGEIDE